MQFSTHGFVFEPNRRADLGGSGTEGLFRAWLAATDALVARDEAASPTFFERNLNVWRQLWRTTETSDILLVLIGMPLSGPSQAACLILTRRLRFPMRTDVRFPLLHYPPALRHYLRTLKPNPKPVVLVLTKTDLVPGWVGDAWKRYFEEEADLAMSAQTEAGDTGAEGIGRVEVVLMESYREKERREETQGESCTSWTSVCFDINFSWSRRQATKPLGSFQPHPHLLDTPSCPRSAAPTPPS